MKLCSDDRGQSLQVGAVLLFGFVVLALTIFQAEAVPEENKEVEFDHSQEVAEDMVSLYTAIFDTVTDGEPRTASITLGTDYNDRLFFIYPPPASGALQTTEPRQLQFHNVTAIEDPSTNQSFDNYWRNETRNYSTRAITYSANYRELTGTADYRIEYGVLAAQYSDNTQLGLADNHQPIIGDMDDDGVTEIEVVVVDGDLQKISSDTEPVIPERLTASTTVTVTNATNTSSITLELPTGLPAENWNTSNSNSVLYDRPDVENVTVRDDPDVSGDVAEIRLSNDTDYDLVLHKVDVGLDATAPTPTYLQNVSYDGTDATFIVRDEFNDRVDRPVDGWVYNSTDNETAEDDFEITDGKRTYDTSGIADDSLCFTIEEDVVNATAYETINISGGCPA
jgi:hypothetical protein